VKTIHIGDLMNPRLFTVRQAMPLRELIEFLRDNRIHGAAVEESGRLMGVVSYTDIANCLSDATPVTQGLFERASWNEELEFEAEIEDELGQLSVRDIMSPKVETCDTDETAGEVAVRMRELEIHRMVVLRGGQAVGLVSATDLLAAIPAYEKQLHVHRGA